jgi:hypothetical protein
MHQNPGNPEQSADFSDVMTEGTVYNKSLAAPLLGAAPPVLGPSRLSGNIRALPSFFPRAETRREGKTGARSAPPLRTHLRHA